MSLFDTLQRITPSSLSTQPDLSHQPPPVEVRDAFYDIVERRRSIRRFTSDPIPDEVFERVIGATVLAPNSSNLQLWNFVRVRDPETKARIAEAALGQPAATTASEIIVCVARWDTWREHRDALLELMGKAALGKAVLEYYQRIVPISYTTGPLGSLGWARAAVSRVASLLRPSPIFAGGRLHPRIVAIKSCALACENLMLAFAAEGFDTCPMEGFDQRRVGRILDLEGEWDIPMLIGVGRRAEGGLYGRRVRLPMDRVVRTI